MRNRQHILRNLAKLLVIASFSVDAMAAPPRLKVARLLPQDWASIEQRLWGRLYAKTRYEEFYWEGRVGERIRHRETREVSKLWDREAVGTPEAQQLLATVALSHYSEVKIFDVGFDANRELLRSPETQTTLQLADNYQLLTRASTVPGYDTHGMSVAYLLAGKSPLPGVSTKGKVALLSDLDPLDDVGLLHHLERPAVINISKTMRVKDFVNFEDIGEKTLLIISAGNAVAVIHNNAILASHSKARTKIIPVGAIDPDGIASAFDGMQSAANLSIVVAAPGDHLFSADGKEEIPFGGTSAAAPIVAGVLADVRSILPELTIAAAVQLLQKTAISTAINEFSELYGAGTVNHYKLIKVALRLAEDGYDGELMPDNLDPYLDFRDEVDEILAASNNLTAVEFFLNLRRAFFLDSSNAEVRTQLANAYRAMELNTQSIFYDLPTSAARHSVVKAKISARTRRFLEVKIRNHIATKYYHDLNAPLEYIHEIMAGTIDQIIANNSSSLKDHFRTYENDDMIDGLPQLAETRYAKASAEAKMIEEIIAGEKLPHILSDAQIAAKLEETAGVLSDSYTVSIHRKYLEISEASTRRIRAIEEELAQFFKNHKEQLTDKEVAARLRSKGITADHVYRYRNPLRKLYEAILKKMHGSILQQLLLG